jgi:hypothetical protein
MVIERQAYLIYSHTECDCDAIKILALSCLCQVNKNRLGIVFVAEGFKAIKPLFYLFIFFLSSLVNV